MSLADKKIGFIGCGNMGAALMKGLVESRLVGPERIIAFDIAPKAFQKAVQNFGLAKAEGVRELVSGSDLVVLAVKPQNMAQVLTEIKEVSAGKLFVSIAAGLSTATIEKGLDPDARVIRVMPNTPALIGQGASAVAPGSQASEEDMALAEALLGAVGQVVRIEEKDMNTVTGLSGSGPAYVFLFMEGLVEAAVGLGLSPETALALAGQTLKGAAELALASEASLADLRRQVTSPGGTTEAGLSRLNKGGFKAIVMEAVEAATKRGEELGKD